MNVVPVLVLVSLSLAALAVLLFVYTTRAGTYDHADRLSLLPLEGEETTKETDADHVGRHGN